jgi:DNA invertase Pin-like site-specific DNA recombinase
LRIGRHVAAGGPPVELIRVSTDKQEESGLGLKAQQAAIETHRNAVDGTLVKTYVEVESGKHDDIDNRPKLQAAVAHALRSNATLGIAKIDRLVRSTVVMSYLKQKKVRFVACDNPYANELLIDILVAVAANEARMISQRTKEALKAYRTDRRVSKRIRQMYPDGVPAEIIEATAGKLGAELPQCRNLTPEGRQRGVARSRMIRHTMAVESYADLVPVMTELRDNGSTLQGIADQLNADGHETRHKKPWNPTQVMRVLNRAELK